MDKEYINFIALQENLHYYKRLKSFLENEIANKKIICPDNNDIYRSFVETRFKKMKVVIFGQDPYHTKDVADGLAFSTKMSKTPPSLSNIFKEIKNEYPNAHFKSNDLASWANQGALLINTSLTVEMGKPNSHSQIGWDIFIKNFIQFLNENKDFLIFVLWGNNAQKLKPFISDRFFILESPHPSPLSARKGFIGNNHFKEINKILLENNLKEINWNT
ncbi:MAG: uracil-DNA glycosylase [Metamycoplasmataceae bacterium]